MEFPSGISQEISLLVSNRHPGLLGRVYRPHYSGGKEVRMVGNDGSQTLLDEGHR